MTDGNFYHDFLGWDYAIWFSGGIILIWVFLISFLRKGNKLNAPKIKWGTNSITILLVLHFVFVAIINPYFFGFGSPNKFKKIYFTENYICLFDTEKDIFIPRDDYDDFELNDHSRIFVVDKKSHKMVYSESIGTNYSYTQIGEEIIFIENSASTHNDFSYIKSVSKFNFETKKRELIANQSGIISVEGRDVKVFEIMISGTIQFNTKDAEVFIYDPEIETFKSAEKFIEKELLKEQQNFRLIPDNLVNNASSLSYKHGDINQRFNYPIYVSEIRIDQMNYCLIKAYEDLTKNVHELSLVSEKGDLKWKIGLPEIESMVNTDLEEIELVAIDSGVCYVTSGAYLIACDLLSGSVLWWLKL